MRSSLKVVAIFIQPPICIYLMLPSKAFVFIGNIKDINIVGRTHWIRGHFPVIKRNSAAS